MIKKIASFLLILTLSLSCLLVGRSLAWGIQPFNSENFDISSQSSLNSDYWLIAIDDVPERYQNGLKLYRETCSGCHIAVPPEVLPMETWQTLLENPDDHYGTSVTGIIRLTQLLMWDYLRTYSRPLNKDEPVPYYIERSRYFKALHPRVPLPNVVTHQTCITCHPGAENFNFRTLRPEWEDAP
jgi:hypothetical protein